MDKTKIFSLTSTFKALEGEADDGSVRIRGMASTADFDRAGDTILAEAWTKGGLENFKRNPIILFNHDYDRPIGKAVDLVITENGLEMEAKISKSAPAHIRDLVKEGILGAFSVGFRIKDADYMPETEGLRIKDAELFEVSVVSVPCNQSATFSLAKSFDSEQEYREFVKSFKQENSVDLAGQSLATEESNLSDLASETPESTPKTGVPQEIKMDKEQELEMLAQKVAEQTAAKIAMKHAEAKAAETKAAEEAAEKARQAEAEKANQQDLVSKAVAAALADAEKRLEEKLAAQEVEITKMRESKRVFSDRKGSEAGNIVKEYGREFMQAHLLGVMTGKGWNTRFAADLQEKAGIAYASSAPDIDQEVSRLIEKEVTLNLRTAGLFREITVNGAATVLPIQPDVERAVFQTGAAAAGNLENRGDSDNTFKPAQVILNAYRLISQTYMDNHVDEEVLVNLMPMLIDSVARAHARAVDFAIINGDGSITGLAGYGTAHSATLSIGDGDKLTALLLMNMRKGMGKYGISPSDVAYVVSQARYYELIEDPAFADITDVGSDVATKITGMVGAVYGSPVIVSDSFPAEAAGAAVAFAVATRNYVIPRLRGVTVEQDYEVGNQRRVIVATQSLGFEELVADAAGNRSCMRLNLAA